VNDAPRCVVSVGAGTAARLLLAVVVLATTSNVRMAAARTIYVRIAGNDANDGSSPARALEHIGRAATVAAPGDRVVVGPGTYREGEITPTAFARISFVADRAGIEVGEPAGDVVVDATGLGNGFELNHNLAVTIDGFIVHGASNGIYVKSQSDQTVVSNNIVTGCSANGIYVQDSKSPTVFNNLVYANGGSGILLSGNVSGSPGARVINNTVYGNGNRGIFFAGTSVGSPNGLVLNNAVQGNSVAGIQVNASSRNGYVSAGNVTADRFASGTPVDVSDLRDDPQFVNPTGADGTLGADGYADDDFHLSQQASGQASDSPALDAGSDGARRLKLWRSTTRTDGRADHGVVDAGYHYGNYTPPPLRPERRLRYKPLYVSSMKGSDANDGARAANAMETIAHALEVAEAGNRIVLLGGTYAEGNLQPSRSGKQGRDILIQGLQGAHIDATRFARGLLLLNRSHITLVGLEISGATENGIEIRGDSTAVTVRSCHLHDNGRRGLYVNGVSGVTVQSTVTDKNGSTGVQVEDGQCNIVNSTLNNNVEQGLWALSEATVSVTGSDLSANQKSGVLADQSAVTIADSTIRGNTDTGARFIDGATGLLTRVVASRNQDGGVQAVSSSVSLSDGAVDDNTPVGIDALGGADSGSSELVVTGTEVCRNQGPGVRAQASASSLTDVTVCANTEEGVRQIGGTAQLVRATVTQNRRGISVSEATSIQLQGGSVTSNGDNGVQVLSTTTATISGSMVASNNGSGVMLSVVPAARVSTSDLSNNVNHGLIADQSGLTVDSSTLRGNGQDGLRHTGGSAQLKGVTVLGNHSKGLEVSGAAQFLLQDAVVGSNGDNGVDISTVAAPSIAGSVMYSNKGDGLTLLDAASATVWNNLVYANDSTGILVTARTGGTGSPMARVLNNTVFANGNRGVFIGGSDAQPASPGATVLRNVVQGNTPAGIQVNQSSLAGYAGDYNLTLDPYGAQTPVGGHDILDDPLLVLPAGKDGILGGTGAADDDFHLSQRGAGQSATSPAVDAGGVDVSAAALQGTTTRTDRVSDSGMVDMGYHYRP
jgi:parallel beta-helix repeat protein